MLAKDLVKLLQEKIAEHEADPEYYSMMGELNIVVDLFKKTGQDYPERVPTFHYAGYSNDIKLEFDVTSGGFIINAFVEENTGQN